MIKKIDECIVSTSNNEQVETIFFNKKSTREFYSILRKRVHDYFEERNISKHANSAMVFKTFFILSVFVGSYFLILSNLFSPLNMLLLAAINGFSAALIGVNIGHDAIHGAYSSNAKTNKAVAIWFNIIGANDYMWNITHNVVHHTYTNIPGHDEDIDQVPILRLNPHQALWWIHRFQHVYVFLLYPFATLSWVFIKDYAKFFKPKIGSYDNSKRNKKELIRMISYKLVYYALFVFIPLLVINLPWYQILFGFLVLHWVEGFALSLIFQLAHIIEEVEFPDPDKQGKMPNSWAAHQLFTTANFACKNPWVKFIFGGLNFQIEHHLFPKVCHIHYGDIAPIVRQTAQEFNLPYIEYKTFYGALQSHVRTLKRFGNSV